MLERLRKHVPEALRRRLGSSAELVPRGSIGGESVDMLFTADGRRLVEEILPDEEGITLHITIAP